MSSKVLTVDTVPAYLMKFADQLQPLLGNDNASLDASTMNVSSILGGNVNYAFCVQLSSSVSVFVKQAPEYVAIFGPDGFPLTSERMQREMDVYQEWKMILSSDSNSTFLPTIYFFDPHTMTVCMEFLEGYQVLDHVLVSSNSTLTTALLTNTAKELGTFMGWTHAATHASQVTSERRDYLIRHYENRPMRDIQLEFVFTKCYKEATEEQRAGLNVTDAFLAEIEQLKTAYNGQGDNPTNLALCHGDLHPGSVMVHPTAATSKSMRVIDPEFTVYAPPGLDVGSLLSGFCLGAVHQAYTTGGSGVAKDIGDAVQSIWNAYAQAMHDQGITDPAMMWQIEVDTVGFTVAEVCRTALEFAGGRKWLQFEDPVTKAAAKQAALRLVDACMIERHQGGIKLLVESLQSIVANAASERKEEVVAEEKKELAMA